MILKYNVPDAFHNNSLQSCLLHWHHSSLRSHHFCVGQTTELDLIWSQTAQDIWPFLNFPTINSSARCGFAIKSNFSSSPDKSVIFFSSSKLKDTKISTRETGHYQGDVYGDQFVDPYCYLKAWCPISSSPRSSPSLSLSVQISMTYPAWFSQRKSNAEIPVLKTLSFNLFYSVRWRSTLGRLSSGRSTVTNKS